jgi:hypothetical protein
MALPRTGMHWFRKTIPADLRQILGKREESLRTKRPGEARALDTKRAGEKWARLRGMPSQITSTSTPRPTNFTTRCLPSTNAIRREKTFN